jgi:hypothetical protein
MALQSRNETFGVTYDDCVVELVKEKILAFKPLSLHDETLYSPMPVDVGKTV